MVDFWKTIVWQQFGAALEMLENAMHDCPDEVWNDRSREPRFWYLIYHTLYWLDFYLSDSRLPYTPPAPFTFDEMDENALLPTEPYSKDDLQKYLESGYEKCRSVVAALTEQSMREEIALGSFAGSRAESLLCNLRHVQHHAAQLNLILRQQTNAAPRWVRKAKLPS